MIIERFLEGKDFLRLNSGPLTVSDIPQKSGTQFLWTLLGHLTT